MFVKHLIRNFCCELADKITCWQSVNELLAQRQSCISSINKKLRVVGVHRHNEVFRLLINLFQAQLLALSSTCTFAVCAFSACVSVELRDSSEFIGTLKHR